MTERALLQGLRDEVRGLCATPRCRECGCLRDAVASLREAIADLAGTPAELVRADLEGALAELPQSEYACLGCDPCEPPEAENRFRAAAEGVLALRPAGECSCGSEPCGGARWPPVPGEYHVLDPDAPVAVSTLASTELSASLAALKPDGLAIVGKTETENIGLEKLIKNVVANPTLAFVIVAGEDSRGHQSGQTLMALAENGVDDEMRVVGSQGRRPHLRNASKAEVEQFRRQVRVVNLIGCDDAARIAAEVRTLASEAPCAGGLSCACVSATPRPPTITAVSRQRVTLDEAGYFVIIPQRDRGVIVTEHYDYEDRLMGVIEGSEAAAICATIVERGLVTRLDHAAYLGRELMRAELALTHALPFVQDKA